MSTQTSPLTASQKRAAHPDFVKTFSLDALRDQLPLRFPVPQGLPPSPKQHYRSEYHYLGYTDLLDPTVLTILGPFEIALRLVDFSPLRDYLAQVYARSVRGQVPFDPVSLFLCICLRRELHCSWRALTSLLAGEHGVGWRRLFGFRDGFTPSASGMRYFFDAVGVETFAELCPLFADLLHQAKLLPDHSTFPGDPPDRGVTISHDLMLHQARSHPDCAFITASCYNPAPRPCPAREAGKEGCCCTDEACAQACHRATPLDPDARLIHYEGRNQDADLSQPNPDRGRNVYGYASTPDRLIDDRFACAWTLRTALHPANADERTTFPIGFATLQSRFPWLSIGEVIADAALGFECCLDPIWRAGAWRMVAIRAAEGDDDPAIQLRRGYDKNGHPLCPHGYSLSPNGYDYQRRRTKWCCAKICQKSQQPVPACPYLDDSHKVGQVVNVGRTLPDGRGRLARDVPYATPLWEQRYGRRNLSESRNGSMENLDLKRLPDYGLTRNYKETALADFLINLHTLGRLLQEATLLAQPATAT